MFLLLSILCSSLINVVFKYFPKYQVDNQQAIMVNYWTCVIVGLLTSNNTVHSLSTNVQSSWGVYTMILGILFITVFISMAVTAQKMGISVSVIAAKMGVVFPVVFAFVALNDPINALLIFGILLSIISVFFVSNKSHIGLTGKSYLLLPLFVLVGSGIIDTSLKVIELQLDGISASAPTILIFFFAAILGTVYTVFRLLHKQTDFVLKNVIAGIVLGIPNYFSIYFLFLALQSNLFKTSQVYPINNIGIVVASTLFSILIFKESLSKRNWTGIALAVVAIILISIGG